MTNKIIIAIDSFNKHKKIIYDVAFNVWQI